MTGAGLPGFTNTLKYQTFCIRIKRDIVYKIDIDLDLVYFSQYGAG